MSRNPNRSRGGQLGDVCALECQHEPIRSEQVISPPAECLRRLSERIEFLTRNRDAIGDYLDTVLSVKSANTESRAAS